MRGHMACFSLSAFETNDQFEGNGCCAFARRIGMWWSGVVTGWVGHLVCVLWRRKNVLSTSEV